MRVKNYIVENLRTANRVITEDLGENAVIISTKPVGGGKYEIVAASEGSTMESPSSQIDSKNGQFHFAEVSDEKKFPPPNETQAAPSQGNLAERIKPFKPQYEAQNSQEHQRQVFMPEVLRQAAFILHNRGVDIDLAIDFVTNFVRGWEKNPYPEQLLRESIERGIQVLGSVPDGVHFFVGYPGEGKSSTIMKLAHHLNEQNRLVAILSLDHSKIAAGEELSNFAQWSGIGYAKIDTPAELQALRRDGVVCLIDTPGNPKDRFWLDAFSDEDFVHLVLDPGRENISPEFFSNLGKKRYLSLTKTDFLRSKGRILTTAMKNKRLPISFISNGPKVPNDIMIPSSSDICSMILGETKKQKRNKWINSFRKSS